MTCNVLLRTIMMGCGMTKPVEHWLRLAYEADTALTADAVLVRDVQRWQL